MSHIIKIIIVLLIELNIYFYLGICMCKIKCFPNVNTFGWKLIYGFLGYHVLFWCFAFPCTFFNVSVTGLAILWGVMICSLTVFTIGLLGIKKIVFFYQEFFSLFKKYKIYVIPCVITICFLIYYVCINGQNDIDAQFYIGEVTTRLDTNRLAGVDVLTGYETNTIGWKHAFTMIGANSAVLCKIFQMRPLVFCRTVRATINILFLTLASFKTFWWIYRGKQHRFEHSIMGVMLSSVFLFLFANTIYTPSRFILYRAYEGKAYCGGTLILILINLVIKLCETNNNKFFYLIFMCMLTGLSICASSVFLLPLLAGSLILAYVLHSHRWQYILLFLVTIFPNLIYCIFYIMKIPSFNLK